MQRNSSSSPSKSPPRSPKRPPQRPPKSGPLEGSTKNGFPYAIRSFVGYLEGTQKAAHTIKSYRLDLSAFQEFVALEHPGKQIRLDELSRIDVSRYRAFLTEKGFKTNTRRRKILTVTLFLNYLAKRKKIGLEMAGKNPAPHKVERVPFTVSVSDLTAAIINLGEDTLLDLRNKVLLWTLGETGCLVSELITMRYDQWIQTSPQSTGVFLGGKSNRIVPVSADLFQAVQSLKNRGEKESSWIFSGFNRFGSLGSPITARGVEMIVKHYGKVLNFPDLTPRMFRHSVILKWFQDGVPQNEIQSRLGLKTTYAFRSYEPLLNSSQSTTHV